MPPKGEVIRFLDNCGINYNKVITFIKKDCKIDSGFEAQRVGLKVPSATTTGLITYILRELNELTAEEELALKGECQLPPSMTHFSPQTLTHPVKHIFIT